MAARVIITGLGTRSFQPTRPSVQGFSAFDDSEWCFQPHQGLCVAAEDRRTGCPPALRSQTAAAAASSCDTVSHLQNRQTLYERGSSPAQRTILWLTFCLLGDL